MLRCSCIWFSFVLLSGCISAYPEGSSQGDAGIRRGEVTTCTNAEGLPGFSGSFVSGGESESAEFHLRATEGKITRLDLEITAARAFTGQQTRAMVEVAIAEQQVEQFKVGSAALKSLAARIIAKLVSGGVL